MTDQELQTYRASLLFEYGIGESNPYLKNENLLS